MATKAATPELSTLIKRGDPVLQHQWIIQGDFNGLPSEYIESIELPFNNVEAAVNLFVGGGYTVFPGFHKIGGINVNFYNDAKLVAFKSLMDWKLRIKDFQTGVYYYPHEYKANVTATLVNSKGEGILSCKLIGIWPTDTSTFTLDQAAEVLHLSQAFSVDDQEWDILV